MTGPRDEVGEALVERLASDLHDAYEESARIYGWATQEPSRVSWDDLPDANRLTMLSAVRAAVLPIIRAEAATDRAELDTLRDRLDKVRAALDLADANWPKGYTDPWGEVAAVMIGVNYLRAIVGPAEAHEDGGR